MNLDKMVTDWYVCLEVQGYLNHTLFQTYPDLNGLVVLSLFLCLTDRFVCQCSSQHG